MTTALGVVLALTSVEGCDGPGPLTAAEVRWRWRHGSIRSLEVIDDGVALTIDCPAEHGVGVVATVTLLTREVREFERRDPLLRRDPFEFVAWRRCHDEAEALSAAGQRAAPSAGGAAVR